MKRFRILFAITIFLFAIACKKDSEIDPVDEPIEEAEEYIGIENFAGPTYSDNLYLDRQLACTLFLEPIQCA
jgi:hypothetical protein